MQSLCNFGDRGSGIGDQGNPRKYDRTVEADLEVGLSTDQGTISLAWNGALAVIPAMIEDQR